jgi:hypothetical protein
VYSSENKRKLIHRQLSLSGTISELSVCAATGFVSMLLFSFYLAQARTNRNFPNIWLFFSPSAASQFNGDLEAKLMQAMAASNMAEPRRTSQFSEISLG